MTRRNVGRRKKVCTECKVLKGLMAFYRHKSGKDGYTSKCRICIRAALRDQGEG